MKSAATAILLLMLTGNAGCFTSWWNGFLNQSELGNFFNQPTSEIRPSISELEEPALLSGATDPTDADLRVVREVPVAEPDDNVIVRIFELLAPGTETAEQKTVQQDGTIYMPVLGWLHVEGLSGREIQEMLVSLLRERQILRDPEVSVTLFKVIQPVFNVIGFVSRPGTFNLVRPDIRLLEALSFAGGLPENAEWIYIYREDDPNPDAIDDGVPSYENEGPTTESAPFEPEPGSPSTLWMEPSVQDDGGGYSQTAWSAMPSAWSQDAPAQNSELLGAASPVQAPPSTQSAAPAQENALPNWIYDPAKDEWRAVAPGETVEQPAPPQAGPPPQSVFDDSIAESGPAATGPTTTSVFEPIVAALDEEIPVNRVIAIPATPLREGDPRYNIVIRERDTIRVTAGEVGEYFMMGHVNRPGAYSINGRKLTLKQAVAAAGGMDQLGWPDRCQIIRRIGEDREQVIQVNLDRIFASQDPDLFLKADDIVNVGSHPVAIFLAVLRSAFRFTYGFGFVYDRNFGDIDTYGQKPNPAIGEAARRNQRLPGLFP